MVLNAKQLRPANDYTKETETTPINEAMRWGSMCEDHAVATYINGMPCKKFEKNRTVGNKGSKWGCLAWCLSRRHSRQ